MVRLSRRGIGAGAAAALLGLLALGVCTAASGMEVILMRHGDKDSQRGDYNLSPAGFARSIALARLIPACFGSPTAITTFVLDPDTSKNARSYQSAVALGVATGVNIRIAVASLSDSEQVGRELRARVARPGERLVLFWEHRRMPELARGLGWPALAPIADDDFDQLLVFRYGTPDGRPQLSRYRQRELFSRPCFQRAPVFLPSQLPLGSSPLP